MAILKVPELPLIGMFYIVIVIPTTKLAGISFFIFVLKIENIKKS